MGQRDIGGGEGEAGQATDDKKLTSQNPTRGGAAVGRPLLSGLRAVT